MTDIDSCDCSNETTVVKAKKQKKNVALSFTGTVV